MVASTGSSFLGPRRCGTEPFGASAVVKLMSLNITIPNSVQPPPQVSKPFRRIEVGEGKRSLTGAGWYFSATHRDPVRQELHGHSYEVMAYWAADPPRDALCLQLTLRDALKGFDHKTLPDELTRAEDIARAIGGLIDGCVRVDVSRPAERLRCEVWL
jgi:hypothetical protein